MFRKYPALQNTDYALVLTGGFISNIGNSVRSIALPLYFFTATGSYVMMTLMMVLNSLPPILLGPLAGAVADRFNRKHTMIIVDIYRALLVGLAVFYAQNHSAVLIFGILMALGSIFFEPCVNAMIPEIVKKEHLTGANALDNALDNAASLIGPLLGGILSFKAAIILDSMTFIVSALLVLMVKYKPTGKVAGKKRGLSFAGFGEIISAVLREKALRTVLGMVLLLALSFGMVPVVFPGYVTKTLGCPDAYYGIFLSLMTLGGLLGSMLNAPLNRRFSNFNLFVIGYGIYGLMYLFLTIANQYLLVGLIMLVQGLTMPLMGVNSVTLQQKLIGNNIRGRFFGIFMSCQALCALCAKLISGPLAQSTSPRLIFSISCILMSLGTLWGIYQIPSSKIMNPADEANHAAL